MLCSGCTCSWIASKVYEIVPPTISDYVYISDNCFTQNDVISMEMSIFNTLLFTPSSILKRTEQIVYRWIANEMDKNHLLNIPSEIKAKIIDFSGFSVGNGNNMTIRNEDFDLISMELGILCSLSFRLQVPTFLNYGKRYTQIASYYLKNETEKKVKSVWDFIMYCMENCVLSYSLCRKSPKLIAAACFLYSCLVRKVFSMNTFKTERLCGVIDYDLKDLLPTMREIHQIMVNAKDSRYKALYKKYCHPNYSNLGRFNFEQCDTNFLHQ